jgi:hypothetical protein
VAVFPQRFKADIERAVPDVQLGQRGAVATARLHPRRRGPQREPALAHPLFEVLQQLTGAGVRCLSERLQIHAPWRNLAAGRGRPPVHHRHQRLSRVAVGQILLDLDGEGLAGIHLFVEELDDLVGNDIGHEHHADPTGPQVVRHLGEEALHSDRRIPAQLSAGHYRTPFAA